MPIMHGMIKSADTITCQPCRLSEPTTQWEYENDKEINLKLEEFKLNSLKKFLLFLPI